MKKFIAGFLCATIMFSVVNASTTIQVLLSPETRVQLKGQLLEMRDANTNLVYPIVYNGTTYLPVRAISQSLGLFVDYDTTTKTVLLDDKPIQQAGYYNPNEYWELPGQWRLTVKSAHFTEVRNQYEKEQPNEIAYIVFDYENLGRNDSLKLEPEIEAITSDGKTVRRYGAVLRDEKGDFLPSPTYIKKGESIKGAYWAFGLDSKDVKSVRVTFKAKDNKFVEHTADFVIPITPLEK